MTGDQFRAMVLSLPGVEERETWGHPTFRVGDRIIVGLAENGTVANVKATKLEQAGLLATDPGTFRSAARTGQHGWVAVQLTLVDPAQLRELVVEAWRRSASKTAVAAYDRQSADHATPGAPTPGEDAS